MTCEVCVSRPRIDPVSWRPSAAPSRARRRSSDVPLPPLDVVEVGGTGPEDVVVAGDGTIYTGTADGLIRRVRVLRDAPAQVDVVADTGGRPLGVEWLPDGRLLVCDAYRGLLAVDVVAGQAAGDDPEALRAAVSVLTDTGDGVPLKLCNNASVGRDGTIWFTDSSARHDLANYRADVYEHAGTGRLLRRDVDGSTHTLVTGLQFANGVALAADESCVFFAETGGYRLGKVLLTGDRAGEVEIVLDNLPGFPDNLSLGDDGLIWMAMPSGRERLVDALAPAPPAVRRLLWSVPEALQPKGKAGPWVMGVDPVSGGVVYDLQGTHPRFKMATGVREHRGRIWLGSLVGGVIASFPIPA
jgi:sugar lactone lactonase YvrE